MASIEDRKIFFIYRWPQFVLKYHQKFRIFSGQRQHNSDALMKNVTNVTNHSRTNWGDLFPSISLRRKCLSFSEPTIWTRRNAFARQLKNFHRRSCITFCGFCTSEYVKTASDSFPQYFDSISIFDRFDEQVRHINTCSGSAPQLCCTSCTMYAISWRGQICTRINHSSSSNKPYIHLSLIIRINYLWIK